MSTTFLQYYPNGSTTYVPQRELSDGGRRASLSEMMNARNKMDDRRKSEIISDKAATLSGVQSLRQGKLPNNSQLDKVMSRLMQSRAIENNKQYMSADGQRLLQDFKELLMVFQRALKTKNRDELFQSMIYHVRRSDEAYQRDHVSTSGNQDVKEEVKSGAGAILRIAKLFLFNTQFRGLLEQILTIAQQSLGVAMQEGGKIVGDKSKGINLSKDSSSNGIKFSKNIFGGQDSPENQQSGNLNTNSSSDNNSGNREDTDHTDEQSGTIFGNHHGSNSFVNQRNLGQSKHQKPSTLSRDEASNVPYDATQNNNAKNSSDQAWLSKNLTPNTKYSENNQQPSTHSQVIEDNGFETNTSSIQPTAQIPDSRLRSALATTRADTGYLNNLSSLNPTAQVSDTDLRNSLAHTSDLNPEAPSFRPEEMNTYNTQKSSLYNDYSTHKSSANSNSLDSGVARQSSTDGHALNFGATKGTNSLHNDPLAHQSLAGRDAVSSGTSRGIESRQNNVSRQSFADGDALDSGVKGVGSPYKDSLAQQSYTNDSSMGESTKRDIGSSQKGTHVHQFLSGGHAANTSTTKGFNSQKNPQSSAQTDFSDTSSTQNDSNSHQNKTFSANRVVNKMKQKAGVSQSATNDSTKNEEEEEDSISTSEIIEQLKEIVTSIQKHPDYQEAISTLFSLFGVWSQRAKTGSGGMDRRRSSAVADPEQAEYYKNVATFEAKTIIEDWAGGKSLDPILQQFYGLSNKFKQDDNLRQLYEKVKKYLQKLLQEPGYVASDQSTSDGDQLVNEIRGSAIEEYKPHIRTMFQQSNDIVQSISNDDTSREISQKFKDIHNHLWLDSNGNASFKPQLINDMRITLLPAIIEQIKYVPLPQIVYGDKQYEIAIENMILEGDTLMPEVFEIKADDYLRFSPYSKTNYTNSQSMYVNMNGIHTTMHDVIFYFKRKTGFPRMSDSGVINLSTGGSGLRISMRITSSSWDQYHTLKVDQCHAYIDKLDIKVSSCKHNIMYKVFNPVLTGIVKRQMCKTIENKMKTMIENGDEKLTRQLRVSKSSISNGTSSGARPGALTHIANLFNQKILSST